LFVYNSVGIKGAFKVDPGIQCDNGGENLKLKECTNGVDWKLELTFKFMARGKPQQNHLVELRFSVMYNRGCVMMNAANIPTEIRYWLY
jgi:hypothetical protein